MTFARRLLMAASVQPGPPAPGGTVSSTAFGAGFMNGCVIADESVHDRHWIGAGDVYGICHSTDRGQTWQMVNNDASNRNTLHGCGAIFHPTVKNLAYFYWAGTGAGGVLMSTDGGATWSNQTSSGSGNLGARTQNSPQPREAGRMIVVDPTGGGSNSQRVLVGTSNGIFLSTDNGQTFPATAWGLAGSNITGMCVDPNNANKLYVTCDAAGSAPGFYSMTGVGSAASAASVTNIKASGTAFNDAQDVFALNVSGKTEVYIAAGGDNGNGGTTVSNPGIWQYDISAASLSNLTPGIMNVGATGTRVSCVDAQVLGGKVMIYVSVGSTSGHQETGNQASSGDFRNIYRSMDSGTTWDYLTRGSQVNNTIGGSGGQQWWLGASNTNWLPNGGYFDASQIRIDPQDSSVVLLSGRSTAWVTTNADTTTASNVQWYPCPNGIGAISIREVTHNPNQPQQMFVSTNDYTAVRSSDGFTLIQPSLMSAGGGAFSGAFDSSGIAYAGTGPDNSGNGNGQVFSSISSSFGANWAAETGNYSVNNEVLGILAWGSSNSRVVLAYYDGTGNGLQRKQGGTGAVFSSVSTVPASSSGRHVKMIRNPGTGNVYLFHPSNGVYRSKDNGATWILIISDCGSNSTDGLGYLGIINNSTKDTLFVTGHYGTADKLKRYDDASTGTGLSGTDITPTGVTAPRTVFYDDATGNLYLASSLEGTPPARLHVMPSGSSSWNIISDTAYQGMAILPISMDVANGYVYVGTLGTGLVMVPV